MRVSFVVPTYRRPDALRSTLEALVSLDYPSNDYEVLVVDDGSGDDTCEVVRAFDGRGPRLRYLEQKNSGVATARNNGATAAHGELLIFLDDDILVQPDHVHAHLVAREIHGDCLVNGHWEFSAATRAALEQTPFGRYRIDVESQVKASNDKVLLGDGRLQPREVTAANLSISAALFRRLGGFDQAFPYAGAEDAEFGQRAREAGCMFVYDPAIQLEHNDQRVTLEQFCRRYQRGAVTSVYLVARHPAAHSSDELLLENAPVTECDPWRWRVKKALKHLYASPVGLFLVRRMVAVLERRAPDSPLLRRLYSMTIGAYIFRGVHEGLRAVPEAREIVRDAMRARFGNA